MRLRLLTATLLVGLVLALAILGLARAVRDEPARTPDVVASEVADSLRCPTCQGLSVADSPAPMAEGMRKIIEEQAAERRTPDEIRGYFVDRYGEWVLLSPPRHGLTWLVWLLPGAAVTVGVVLAWRAVRRRRQTVQVDEADLEEGRRVYADYLTGRYAPDYTPAGERVEAALELLVSIDEEGATDDGGPARKDAENRLAAALMTYDADATPSTSSPDPDHALEPDDAPEPTNVSARTRSTRRWPVYGTAVASFVVVLAGLLVVNLGGRGPDGLPTGLLAGQTAPADAEADAEIEAIRTQTRERPDDPDVWLTLGRVLDEAGRLADAYTAYEQALGLDPASIEAGQLAAWALIRGGASGEAIPLLEPLVQENPDNAQSVLLLGLAQHGADDPAATATLRRYVDLEPTGPQSDQVRGLLGESSTPSPRP
ncbi:MAG: cytochrome c-type biogenesis protein CcmH [Jiangellaceae bacterium]